MKRILVWHDFTIQNAHMPILVISMFTRRYNSWHQENTFFCFPVIQVKKCVIVLLIANFPIPSHSFPTQNSKKKEGLCLQTFQERGQTSFLKFQNFAPPTFYLSASYYMHGKIPCLFASLYYASRIWLFPPSSSPNQEMQNKKVCTIQGWRKISKSGGRVIRQHASAAAALSWSAKIWGAPPLPPFMLNLRMCFKKAESCVRTTN